MNLKQKAADGISKVKTYWKTPMAGRYMNFREIAAYSGGGIGAYMIITMGSACLLSSNNVLLSSALGIDPTDMYIMYVIAVLQISPSQVFVQTSLTTQETKQVNTDLTYSQWHFLPQLYVPQWSGSPTTY